MTELSVLIRDLLWFCRHRRFIFGTLRRATERHPGARQHAAELLALR